MFHFTKNCNKSCIGWFKALRGPFDRSQNLGPNCLNVLGIFGLAVTVQNFSGLFVWKLCIKIML